MKRLNSIVLTLAIILSISCSAAFAQEGHYFVVTTWKITVPADGTNAELVGMMKEWQDKVIKKNDKIISEKVLRHGYGSDMRDWVFITEYASWADIDAANKQQDKLIEAAWPDEEKRKDFFKNFSKYMVTHSDEIYIDLPELSK